MATPEKLLSTENAEQQATPKAQEIGEPEAEWSTANYANFRFDATVGVSPDSLPLTETTELPGADDSNPLKEAEEDANKKDDEKKDAVAEENNEEDKPKTADELHTEADTEITDLKADDEMRTEADTEEDDADDSEDETLDLDLSDLVDDEDSEVVELSGDEEETSDEDEDSEFTPEEDDAVWKDEDEDDMKVECAVTQEENGDGDDEEKKDAVAEENGDDEEKKDAVAEENGDGAEDEEKKDAVAEENGDGDDEEKKDAVAEENGDGAEDEEKKDAVAEENGDDEEKKEPAKSMAEGKLKISFKMNEAKRLFENNTVLTEEDKRQSRVLFESAVRSVAKQIGEQFRDVYQARFDEAKKQHEEKASKQIDQYMSYVVEQWIKDNKIALQSQLRNRLTDSFITGLQKLFVEHYVEVPKSKINVVEALAKNVKSLKTKLKNAEAQNVKLHTEAKAAVKRERIALKKEHKSRLIAEAAGAVTAADRGAFVERANTVKFTGTKEFKKDLIALRDQYFRATKSVERPSNEPAAAPLFETKPSTNSSVDTYTKIVDRLTGRS